MSTPATNDITGDRIKSKENTDKFRSGYDLIFGKKPAKEAACAHCIDGCYICREGFDAD